MKRPAPTAGVAGLPVLFLLRALALGLRRAEVQRQLAVLRGDGRFLPLHAVDCLLYTSRCV